MWKWIGGIVAAVLIWWLTQGAVTYLTPKPPPPQPVAPPQRYSATGYWTYTMRSDVSNSSHTGSMTLTQDGALITGVFEAFDKSKSGVKGSISGDTVELSRDTGLDTVQTYRLARSGDRRLKGSFENVGKYPDRGSIELVR